MRPRLRPDRLAVVAIGLLLAVASGLYFVIQRGKLGDTRLATDKTLVMTLAVLLFVVALGLVWFMFRHLARLLAGRRRGLLGARLQARVVFTFLFLILIPTVTLFSGAVTIVSRTLKELAPPDLERIAGLGRAVADEVEAAAERDAQRFARLIARELEAAGRGAPDRWPQGWVAKRLGSLRQRYGLAAVGFRVQGGAPVQVAAAPSRGGPAPRPEELGRAPAGLTEAVLTSGQGRVTGERLAYGWRAVAIEPLEGGRAVVWAVELLPERTAAKVEALRQGALEVSDFRRRRPAVQRLYVVLFALLTAVVLFGTVWTGLFLARQVTGPLLGLMRGTEALGRGELGHRVREWGDADIARLARSFNRMAERIERQQAALEQRRRYIETLLEAIPVGVVSLDGEGCVLTANRSALETLRLDALPQGTPLRRALAGGREAVWDVVASAVQGSSGRVAAEVAIAAGGTGVSLEVSAERFEIAPGRSGTLVVLEDMTRLRRAERLAAWGEVARRVAHEIKNPLTPIRLSAERMARRYRQDPAAARKAIEDGARTIVREVESLRRLVDEFSRFARLPEVELAEGDLRELVREVVSAYAGQPEGPEVTADTEAALPPHRFDPEAMRRVLINLIENAVAAAGPDGHVTVRTRWHRARRTILLEVIDDGEGLPPGDRNRLFLPSFTRRPGGTGLGLAIVHRIITEHGGWVRAEDNDGGGTRMIVEIPAGGMQREDAAEARGEERDARKG
ncbi:MAG: HAMP domain-containing protein [Acidobacteria bacterium]|nr:MAG: HAMP domain-containing protein [Acidobacteriota bacterium]